MARLDLDSNGNQWYEDLSEAGFKRIVTDFKKNNLQLDMRNQPMSKTDYNASVVVFTPENGTKAIFVLYNLNLGTCRMSLD